MSDALQVLKINRLQITIKVGNEKDPLEIIPIYLIVIGFDIRIFTPSLYDEYFSTGFLNIKITLTLRWSGSVHTQVTQWAYLGQVVKTPKKGQRRF